MTCVHISLGGTLVDRIGQKGTLGTLNENDVVLYGSPVIPQDVIPELVTTQVNRSCSDYL